MADDVGEWWLGGGFGAFGQEGRRILKRQYCGLKLKVRGMLDRGLKRSLRQIMWGVVAQWWCSVPSVWKVTGSYLTLTAT